MAKQLAVVFGGSGFLGSSVADALTEAGMSVRIFDSRPSPYLTGDQQMIVGNILDLEAVKAAVSDSDFVYNFAAIADLADCARNPLAAAQINVIGTVNILEACVLHKIQRSILASSVYVYSKSGGFYRATKQAAEQFIETYGETYKLPYTILRYGTLYGRRADERNSVYRLIKEAVEKGTITYDGDPDEMREYIHVEDAARLSVEILKPEFENRNLVITGTERIAVKSLIRMIAEILPGDIKIRFNPTRPTTGHYVMTPYSYNPKPGHKLTSVDYVDIGQGLLGCIAKICEADPYHQIKPWIPPQTPRHDS